MELIITDLNTELSNENIARIRQKIRRTFNQVSDRIQLVKVTLNDVNGPKGGKDKCCKVMINTHGMQDVVITENQSSVMSAINIALSKARLSLIKKVKRKQQNQPVFSPAKDIELSTLVELERQNLVVK